MTCSDLPWQIHLFVASLEADAEQLLRQGHDILLPCLVLASEWRDVHCKRVSCVLHRHPKAEWLDIAAETSVRREA